MKIILPIYYTIKKKTKKDQTILVGLNFYRNAHYLISNKIKHYYHNLIAEQVKETIRTPIKLHYEVYIKRRNTDYWNIRSILEKFVLDWLVENWIIPDDSFDYVKGDTTEVFLDKKNPRIEILIITI